MSHFFPILQATGGSGNYTWTSTQSDVATVNVKGEIATKDLGSSEVTASDMKNTDIKGSMIVSRICRRNSEMIFQYPAYILSQSYSYTHVTTV
jgi:hypothetical protein